MTVRVRHTHQIRPLWVTQKTRHFSSSQTSSHCDRRVLAVISCNTSYVTYPPRHSPPPSFRFFYSNKNHLVQLEATTIQTERGSSMQHTKRMTVAHHRSDFIHHVTRADWQEEWGEEEWGSTDKKSESRQTRSVRRDRQEVWGETDKKSEVRQTRRVRRDRKEKWGETDKKSQARKTRRVKWDRQEEWGETDKKSDVRQARRVRWDRQEEWGETDKKSDARQTRRLRRDRQEDWGETEKKS